MRFIVAFILLLFPAITTSWLYHVVIGIEVFDLNFLIPALTVSALAVTGIINLMIGNSKIGYSSAVLASGILVVFGGVSAILCLRSACGPAGAIALLLCLIHVPALILSVTQIIKLRRLPVR